MTSGVAQPVTLTLRPLIGGMRTDSATLMMPSGSFRNVDGYDVKSYGLRRVDGKRLFIPDPVPFWNADEFVTEIAGYWGTDDKQFNVAITNKALYKVEFASPGGYYTPVWWQRDYTVDTYSDVTGVLTFDTNSPEDDLVRVGDYVVLDSAPTTRYAITDVDGMTVTIDTGLAIDPADGFHVLREFQVSKPFYVDHTVYARTTAAWMILVDGSVDGIYAYNGGYLKPFVLHDDAETPGATYNSARTVMYFGGRLYFGCVGLTGYTYRQRIIWTDVLDLNEVPATAYQDLDETPGQILKLVGLGSLAFAYFSDAAYYGRETNLDGLPYAFTRLDTGGVGLAGQRAATPFFDGQMFVASDEIYYVTTAGGLETIGTPVLRESVEHALAAGTLDRTIVRVDVPRQRVLFGFSFGGGEELSVVYALNYKLKAWSQMHQGAVTTFNVVNFADEVEYDDIDVDATYADYADVAYTSFGGSFADRQLTSVDSSGYIYTLHDDSPADLDNAGLETAIPAVLETGDFDLDEPDAYKALFDLRVKLARTNVPRTTPVQWRVHVSVDCGESWKSCGVLTIPTFKSEGAVSCRTTGSHFRFRLESESIVEPYEISEMTIRATVRNLEANRAATTSNP